MRETRFPRSTSPRKGNGARSALGTHRDPHGIVTRRDGRAVFVTCEADRSVVELTPKGQSGWTVSRSVATGREMTHMVALAPDGGTLYAADLGGTVSVIDANSFRLVRQVPTGAGSEGIDVEPGGAHVWAANKSADTLTVFEAKSGASRRRSLARSGRSG